MGESAWNFTPVIRLNSSLSSGAERFPGVKPPQLALESPSNLLSSSDDRQNPPGLGNFDKLWIYLHLPLSDPSIQVESQLEGTVTATAAQPKDLCNQSRPYKGVRWCDETESADLADREEIPSTGLALDFVKKLTKKERIRKRLEEIKRGSSAQNVITTETHNRIYDLRPRRPRSATEAVIQNILSDTSAGPKTPSKADRSVGRPGGVSDHDKDYVPPLRHIRGTLAEFPLVDQTAYKTAAEKKEHLMKALRSNFPEEQKFLDNISFVQLLDESTASRAHDIHVFVDASNIMIGFQECLKRLRGIPISKRMRFEPFSYHSLSLVLERGRPAAKRVLVGSDKFPAIQEAKLIGYETNILERVHKAKELTPRQQKYKKNYNSTSYNSTTGQSSSSETTVGLAPEKWVEQAVDEILHLKMLESVVDAKTPSTMVLATGDAAEAEYSEGFFKMVERCLEKGWKVELVSFKHNIGGAYKRKDFRGKWKTQFKIITLDEYVEQLVGS